jgi:hypothetical protein
MKALRFILIFISSCLLYSYSSAQNVGINTTGTTPASSAGLDVDFTDKGLLIPRVALTAKNAAGPITSPTTSLLVYNTATAGTSPNNVNPGYYYWNGTSWDRLRTEINKKFLASDVSSSSTTLANVTGLSFPITTGVNYRFKFFIVFTATNSNLGTRWTINGPTATTLRFYSTYPSSTTGGNVTYHQSAYDGAVITTNSATTTCNIAIIEGIVNCSSSASEVIVRFASEGASITAKAGLSYVEWEILD